MKLIKEIALELFKIKKQVPSRSGGEHEVSLESVVDRSKQKDVWPVKTDKLARYIDHTMLKPYATEKDIVQLCKEADKYGFYSVCVNPVYVKLAKKHIKKVKICSVVGFPHGANTSKIKNEEAKLALQEGASEIDMVISLGLLISEKYDDVYEEIKLLAETCHQNGAILKVILETAILTLEQKIKAALLAKKAGADFVKTSTGFAAGGAIERDVELLRKIVGPKMGVKASGGIGTKEKAIAMLEAGANRIGASRSIEIVK
ncbi:MAG: deoxyribose-phosphate aldolase [Candidatus Cloacimonadota bacterium]|nr:deoxyribose-phosphate aldolase [Candidatus Cloacimonadota bacterium]